MPVPTLEFVYSGVEKVTLASYLDSGEQFGGIKVCLCQNSTSLKPNFETVMIVPRKW